MAKETKAERTLREANDRAAREVEQATTYVPRLMALMERAQAANFELEVSKMTFVLRDRDDRDYEKFVMELTYSPDADEQLDELDWRVNSKEERYAEENRRREARANALAKLSKEEKELLGL